MVVDDLGSKSSDTAKRSQPSESMKASYVSWGKPEPVVAGTSDVMSRVISAMRYVRLLSLHLSLLELFWLPERSER